MSAEEPPEVDTRDMRNESRNDSPPKKDGSATVGITVALGRLQGAA